MRYSHFKCLLYSLPLGPREAAAFCVLAVALSGGPFAFEDRCRSQTATTSKGWQFLLLIDPAHADTAFSEYVSSLVNATKKSDAGRLLPGERHHQARSKSIYEGIAFDLAAMRP